MKNIARTNIIVIAMIATATPLLAGQNRNCHKISRELLAEKQARKIAESLSLSPEISGKFISVYINCQKEIWSLGPREGGGECAMISDQQADSLIQARFDHSQKILDIRKKYYKEYWKFLNPKQIEKVYRMESRMMRHLKGHREGKRRGRR